jgi:predicted dinucleotide-binding enzyme
VGKPGLTHERGIVGIGNLGTGLAKHLIPKGHAVMLSFSKEPDNMAAAAGSLGATVGTPMQAVVGFAGASF